MMPLPLCTVPDSVPELVEGAEGSVSESVPEPPESGSSTSPKVEVTRFTSLPVRS